MTTSLQWCGHSFPGCFWASFSFMALARTPLGVWGTKRGTSKPPFLNQVRFWSSFFLCRLSSSHDLGDLWAFHHFPLLRAFYQILLLQIWPLVICNFHCSRTVSSSQKDHSGVLQLFPKARSCWCFSLSLWLLESEEIILWSFCRYN